MMNTILQTMQRRRILFLMSLPNTDEFHECKDVVDECLEELHLLNVDVREHIWREDLAEANNYDVVIVVAHHDISSNELILANGTLPIKDFVGSIPSDFKGIIDFSSCYSTIVFNAIKERCPECKVQVALFEITLLRRLIIYPTLIDHFCNNPTIDYGEEFKKLNKAFDDFMEEMDDTNTSMTHLGQKRTSVYAPLQAKRKQLIPINVFIHYDSEDEVVRRKASKGTDIHINSEDLGEVNIGDALTITLSFISGYDTQYLHVEGSNSKNVVVTNDFIKEYFIVKIDEEYNAPNFGCSIDILKECSLIRKYPIFIDVVGSENKAISEMPVETPQHSEKPSEIIEKYVSAFAGGGNIGTKLRPVRSKLFKQSTYEQFISRIIGNSDEEKLSAIRKYIYNGDLFLDTISTFLQKCETRLKEIRSKYSHDTEIKHDLLPLLLGYATKMQRKTESLDNKLTGIKKRKGMIRYEDAALLFIPLEDMFLKLVQQVTNLDYQIDSLSAFRELREAIISNQNAEEIKTLSEQFYEHPHFNNADKDLYDLFKSSGTGSIIHTTSNGTTMPFLALAIAMALGEYTSSDKGKEDWVMNVEKYIHFSEKYDSLRTPKSRINKLVGMLDDKEIRNIIKNYQKTEAGKISIAAYYLLKIKVKVQ